MKSLLKGSKGTKHGFGCPPAGHFWLLLALVVAGPEPQAVAIEKDRLVPAGRLVIEGRRLSCGSTKTLLRDFEGFAVSSTVIMLNMQALNPLPRQVQWLIYYHECGHILLGPSETSADCYAVRRARREGWLNDQALNDVCALFNIAGHGPFIPIRKRAAINFANASPRRA